MSEFELKKCERDLKRFMDTHRPPAHIRNELDLAYRIRNQSVEIFEVRPHWRNSSEIMEHAVAKATYVKTQKLWKIYWQRADLKWHKYDPVPTEKTLEEFLNIVGEDKHACFFG